MRDDIRAGAEALIVDNLRSAFPRCQFIATTHSPQVIGEVEHDQIRIIADIAWRSDGAVGLCFAEDQPWILRLIPFAQSRPLSYTN